MTNKYVTLPQILKTGSNINAYSIEGAELKKQFHVKGKEFLNKLAAVIGLQKGEFEVRNNAGGMAVSGEVTLHSDDIYSEISRD